MKRLAISLAAGLAAATLLPAQLPVVDVGIDASGGLALSGDRAAFAVSEAAEGQTDLNGDGDFNDLVLHIHDFASDVTTNVGLDASGGFWIDGDHVAFAVSELAEGIDLNNDSDTDDLVLHVYDIAADAKKNLELEAFFGFQLNGDRVAVAVDEALQGAADLNGDGDTSDLVLHVYDFSTDTTENLGYDVLAYQLDGNRLAFQVDEFGQDMTDFNADGDATDFILHVRDFSSPAAQNLGIDANSFVLSGDHLAFLVFELRQGMTDFNGDGDVGDFIVHVYDFSGAPPVSLDLATIFLGIDGDWLAFPVIEFFQGADLNGDTDTNDFVLFAYDFSSSNTVNTALDASGGAVVTAGRVAFSVSEAAQANQDLNGDSDTGDFVIHVQDLATANTTNLMLDGLGGFDFDGDSLAWLVSEFNQGGADLNGDGDSSDFVVHTRSLAAGSTNNLGLEASSGAWLAGDRSVFLVSEAEQAADLNGDGDMTDLVLHVYDFATNTTENLGLATGFDVRLSDDRLLFTVSEGDQASTDLNGDSDALDLVLHGVGFSPGENDEPEPGEPPSWNPAPPNAGRPEDKGPPPGRVPPNAGPPAQKPGSAPKA